MQQTVITHPSRLHRHISQNHANHRRIEKLRHISVHQTKHQRRVGDRRLIAKTAQSV